VDLLFPLPSDRKEALFLWVRTTAHSPSVIFNRIKLREPEVERMCPSPAPEAKKSQTKKYEMQIEIVSMPKLEI
jgi:hypothetical protein